ncbi:response regulator [Flavobacteriaceae bacterium F89]|uniref:Response regulator n=1 Tax=Cerina litoralis TaxID=2874477 RepID=A0AAE3EV79_9FLAO|nr:response regulator [Cerina litoralis]MCG2460316.1 response regulator [Cerina litoralis]
MENTFKKIILVDDDPDDRDIFSDAFQNLKLQAELLLLESGHQFMDYMEKIDLAIPTIVFLDLNMPIISGLDCLKYLREKIADTNYFVTIYSTSASERDMEKAYLLGANGYLKKPTGFRQLQDMMLKTIKTGSTIKDTPLSRAEFLLNGKEQKDK